MEPVVIVATGIGNTASVAAAVRRCGCECMITTDSGLVRDAGRVVLPGVGSFGAGMRCLRDNGLAGVIRERVEEGRPLLAVCLGMQLLCASSDESPGVDGLGLVDAPVRRFPAEVRTPQFGWNRVGSGGGLVRDGYAYFANSYCLTAPPAGWTVSTATHGLAFVAAMERGPVLACQFHPELSGEWGQSLIGRWIGHEEVRAAC